jgi:hypothetical protein
MWVERTQLLDLGAGNPVGLAKLVQRGFREETELFLEFNQLLKQIHISQGSVARTIERIGFRTRDPSSG